MKSYIHIYTGNGKGKTTASLGLALRALGAGKSVFIGQFLKNGDYSEIRMLQKMEGLLETDQTLRVEQYGEPHFINRKPGPEDYKAAEKGWMSIKEGVLSQKYDLVIMEEINVAVHLELIPEDQVLELMRNKPDDVELVLTGRYASEKIMEAADLVSRVDEVKHYFSKGVQARIGIEK